MKLIIRLRFWSLLFLFAGCNTTAPIKQINKFSNNEILKIYDLGDQGKTAELFTYFSNTDSILRAEAVLTFASHPDSSVIALLENLLQDSAQKVRINAAYALGQAGSASDAKAIIKALSTESIPAVRSNMLEAIGKIGGALSLNGAYQDQFNSIIECLKSIEIKEDEEKLGWAKAAFWINLSGWKETDLMDKCLLLLEEKGDFRLSCAQAMAQHKGKWFEDDNNAEKVFACCRIENNEQVRALQMNMLAKINSATAKGIVLGYLNSQIRDQITKVAAARACGQMSLITPRDLLSALYDPDDYVVQECLVALEKKAIGNELTAIREACKSRSVQIQCAVFRIMLANGQPKAAAELWMMFQNGKTAYDKVNCALAMGQAEELSDSIFKLVLTEKDYAIKYALTQAFIESHGKRKNPSPFFEAKCIQLFALNDIGVQALVAESLRNHPHSDAMKKEINDKFQFALTTLKLPQEIETYNEIVKTINTLGIDHLEEKKAVYNHPIDWDLVQQIPENQKARITTTKGVFTIELKVNEAPGSVANFVALTNQGFYNGKYFHRVIPNFVIQGGCPRGDGMGATDYTIRSEFNLHEYSAGAVGLASSGRNTESCQWFVSHRHTPHLEGRYTIFGYVISGMEVIQKITVGDVMLKVEIIN